MATEFLDKAAVESRDELRQPWGEPLEGTQPGGGLGWSLERGWARLRRWMLRAFRPSYVRRMEHLRQGECPNCPHDVVDSRDLKFVRNVCGYRFPPEADPHGWRDRFWIARDGWAEICLFGLPLLGLAFGAALLSPWLALVPSALVVAVVLFFRNPRRPIPSGPGLMVAPADGRVTDVTDVEHMPMVGGPAVRIGIFLSIFDVHVNRCPERGVVIDARYRRGRFLDARHPDAGVRNESTTILFRNDDLPGRYFVVRQVAGAVARRIVCYAGPGREFDRGDVLGLIKFGSRTELYVARDPDLEILVRPGQRVYAGESVLVRYGARAVSGGAGFSHESPSDSSNGQEEFDDAQ